MYILSFCTSDENTGREIRVNLPEGMKPFFRNGHIDG